MDRSVWTRDEASERLRGRFSLSSRSSADSILWLMCFAPNKGPDALMNDLEASLALLILMYERPRDPFSLPLTYFLNRLYFC